MSFSSISSFQSVINKNKNIKYYVNPPTDISLTNITSSSMILTYTDSRTNGFDLTYHASVSPASSFGNGYDFSSNSTIIFLNGLSYNTSYTVTLYATVNTVLSSTQVTTSASTNNNLTLTSQYNGQKIGGGSVTGISYELYTFRSNGNITFSGIGNIYYVLVGGGGGGGSTAGGSGTPGSGAGGVTSGIISFDSSTNTTITVNIGQGGNALGDPTKNGGIYIGYSGGNTTLSYSSTVIQATGGSGGGNAVVGSSGGTSKELTGVTGVTESGSSTNGGASGVSVASITGYTFTLSGETIRPSYTANLASGSGGGNNGNNTPLNNSYGAGQGGTNNVLGAITAFINTGSGAGGERSYINSVSANYSYGGSGIGYLFFSPSLTSLPSYSSFLTITGNYFTSVYGNYTLFTFYGNGTIQPLTKNYKFQTLIVAGGGGGGGGNTTGSGNSGGGGGAGGVGVGNLTFNQNTTYTITIGNGGIGGAANNNGSNGSNTTISGGSINEIANGGGGGGTVGAAGSNGGSGGGSSNNSTVATSNPKGSGTLTYYGNNGNGTVSGGKGGCGGGGASNQGSLSNNTYYGGNGGNGYYWSINGSTYGGGGGGGGMYLDISGYYYGGLGGSGGGGKGGGSVNCYAPSGTPNTGGGGGGGASGGISNGGNGGSGVVVLAILSYQIYWVTTPTSLAISAYTATSITITYGASTTDGSGITYYATTLPTSSTFSSASTSMTLTGLTSNTVYTIYLYAQNIQGYYSTTTSISGSATFSLNDDSALALYYPFNIDASNYATGIAVTDATLINGASINNSNYIVGSGSISFSSSSSQYLSLNSSNINSASFPGTNGLTFSSWFQSNSNGTWARIFDFGNGSDNNNIYLYINNNNIGVGVFIDTTGNTTGYWMQNINGTNYNTNVWYHVAWTLTYSSSNTSTWTVYINGTSEWSSSGYVYPKSIARENNYIGKSNWDDPYWNGNIDDFRCYQRVLSSAEVTDIFNFTPLHI